MTSASLSKSKSSRREATLGARQRQLKALAKRPARASGRRSARWEIFGIFVLGLGLVVFPWGRVGAALNGTQERPEFAEAGSDSASVPRETLTDRSCTEDKVVAVRAGTGHGTAAADTMRCLPGQ